MTTVQKKRHLRPAKRRTAKNPADPITTFAALAGGVASALQIGEHMNRKAPAKRRGKTKAKRNPRLSVPKSKHGNLYVLTISRGDDIETVYLHDGKGDGFSKRFKTMAGAKAYATRNKVKLNPARIIRKRNVDGFVDGAGVFHPIRQSEGYDGGAAGDHRPAAKRRSVSARNLIAAAKKATTQTQYNNAVTKLAKKLDTTVSQALKKVGTFKGKKPATVTPKVRKGQKVAVARRPRSSIRKNPIKVYEYRFGKARGPVFVQEYSRLAAWKRLTLAQRLMFAKVKGTVIEHGFDDYHAGKSKGRKLNPSYFYKLKDGDMLVEGVTRAATRGGAARKVRREYGVKRVAIKRVNPKATPRRRTFEMFQGRKATTAKRLAVSRHAPAKLDQLGDLIELKLYGQAPIKFNGKTAKLCASRGRLWIAGKRFAKPNPAAAANEINPVGEIDHVVYGTYKPHHGDMQYTHYIHKLGEESGTLPTLCVDREGYPVIRGGNYKIEARGIVD